MPSPNIYEQLTAKYFDLDGFKHAIETDDTTHLIDILQVVELSAIPLTERIGILIYLLTLTQKKPAMMKPILEKWSANTDDIAGTVGDLLASPLCPMTAVKTIIDYYDLTPVEILDEQISASEDATIIAVYQKMRDLFGPEIYDRDDIDTLLEIVEPTGRTELIEHFRTQQAEYTDATTPSWVNVREGETTRLLDMAIWDLPPPVLPDEVKETTTELLSKVNVDGDIEREELESMMTIANSVKPLEMKELPGDPDRMFGPVNRFPRSAECLSGVVRGGCRMLTCMCREFDPDYDEIPPSRDPEGWFTGRCDGCRKRIQDISYALRFPIIGGGWVGCYCSVDCLREAPPRDANQLNEFLLDTIYGVIEVKGIIDRVALKKVAS